ncbi:uncharacterized protein LOC131149388 [Malania oleifera]|uniref:uncharacterized protein LOC131149388 n=1 Tax=Malania oleifera TaxID=397392 RepID=UPI0025ADE11E|nr:uncharacterized protein LOC131149388 [Malania oleifera]
MAGKRELGFLKPSVCSLREQAARTTLQNVRMQGHTYVELREDGKRFVFFCTLCLAPCYSDSVLFDHLKGNLHSERYAAAKVTLLGANPWPFNDGVHFFNNSSENETQLAISNDQIKLLESGHNDNSLAIVSHNGNVKPSLNQDGRCYGYACKNNLDYEEDLSGCVMENGGDSDVLIPGVLFRDEISDLGARFVGFGQISAKLCEKDGILKGMSRIWCEWLGKKDLADQDLFIIPEHEYAVVIFSYSYDLGRKSLFDDVKFLLPSNSPTEIESDELPRKKRKSFSDPEDISKSLSNQYDSSGEDSLSANSSPRLLLDQYDDQLLLHKRSTSSKALRRELRRQQRVAAERMCDICQHKMLPGKDVATLLNMKTERFACSSRNVSGAFHVFHTSCLIHWILFCESEMFRYQLVQPKARRRSRRKNEAKCKDMGKNSETKATEVQICSVFCPECQGTGLSIDGDDMEKPTIPLSEMFKFKIKVSDAHRAWMKSPEVLQNCSTGFNFASQSKETVQEKVSPLKLLHFYSADGWWKKG